MESNNIQFEDLNVATDKVARDEMISRSGQMSVPVIDIDGELLLGFDQDQVKEKLGL